MDKLTLTRQFGIHSIFSLGGIGKELEWNKIDSYRRKGSLLIQTLYLWDRDRGRGKNRRFHIVLLIEKSIRLISYPSFNEKMGQILQDQTYGT
jgi:hypothetical protein